VRRKDETTHLVDILGGCHIAAIPRYELERRDQDIAKLQAANAALKAGMTATEDTYDAVESAGSDLSDALLEALEQYIDEEVSDEKDAA
jgi:hypothetical protein